MTFIVVVLANSTMGAIRSPRRHNDPLAVPVSWPSIDRVLRRHPGVGDLFPSAAQVGVTPV